MIGHAKRYYHERYNHDDTTLRPGKKIYNNLNSFFIFIDRAPLKCLKFSKPTSRSSVNKSSHPSLKFVKILSLFEIKNTVTSLTTIDQSFFSSPTFKLIRREKKLLRENLSEF